MDLMDKIKTMLQRPLLYIAMAIVTIFLYGTTTDSWKEPILIGLVFFAAYHLVAFIIKLDIVTHLRQFIDGRTELDVVIHNDRLNAATSAVVPEILAAKQVFHIPENTFTYPDAKAVCTAYGARLANYEELAESQKQGGEWCSYGWSENQMALFPTQQSTWEKLQTIEGHENDCGRPGINGGYMANPALKFGVNCYGYKPRITDAEETIMANATPYPKTYKDIALEKRVDYWKTQLENVIVAPFNAKRWSRV